MKLHRLFLTGAMFTAALTTACSGGEKKASTDSAGAPAADAAASSGAAAAPASGAFSTTQLAPESGRKVVTVQLETDPQGVNRFDPANFEVHQGDVIRFTLKSGAHNVHFLADSNPNVRGLPTQPSDILQLPGQTLDLKVNWAPGKHYFQCDPHALLGMIGHVKVED